MKKCLIKLNDEGVIIEKHVAPDPTLIEAPDDVVCGMMLKDGKYVRPTPPKPDPLFMRQRNYAPTGDQLDAIMKGFAALMEQGIELPEDTQDWVKHCQQVKKEFPDD